MCNVCIYYIVIFLSLDLGNMRIDISIYNHQKLPVQKYNDRLCSGYI